MNIIAALSLNHVIGHKGKIPWHIPADLARFKMLTTQHLVLMGRRTWESLPVQPLPNRRCVVLTHNHEYEAKGAAVVHTQPQAAQLLMRDPGAFVIGGSQLYEDFLPYAKTLYLTRVHVEVKGDAYFPLLNMRQWSCSEKSETHTHEGVSYHYETLIRTPRKDALSDHPHPDNTFTLR